MNPFNFPEGATIRVFCSLCNKREATGDIIMGDGVSFPICDECVAQAEGRGTEVDRGGE